MDFVWEGGSVWGDCREERKRRDASCDMELVSKPNATAAVWEHFGFKPNDRGEPLNLSEPVCRICFKTVSTKTGNTTNMHMHLKHNHPLQFCLLWNACCAYCLIFLKCNLFTSILFIVFGIYSSAFFVNRDWESIAFIVFGCFVHCYCGYLKCFPFSVLNSLWK